MTHFHITRYNVQETLLFTTHMIDSSFYVAYSRPAPSDIKNWQSRALWPLSCRLSCNCATFIQYSSEPVRPKVCRFRESFPQLGSRLPQQASVIEKPRRWHTRGCCATDRKVPNDFMFMVPCIKIYSMK